MEQPTEPAPWIWIQSDTTSWTAACPARRSHVAQTLITEAMGQHGEVGGWVWRVTSMFPPWGQQPESISPVGTWEPDMQAGWPAGGSRSPEEKANTFSS